MVGGFRIGRGCRGRSKVVVVVVEEGIGMEEEEEEEESMVDDIVVVVVVAVDAEVEGQSSQVRHSFRQFFFPVCLFVLIYYVSILFDPESLLDLESVTKKNG